MNSFYPLLFLLFLSLGQVLANSPAEKLITFEGSLSTTNTSDFDEASFTSGCLTPSNLALNKTAEQSSTYNSQNYNGNASKAVDGNTNGCFYPGPATTPSVSATNSENQAYWQVDLGEVYSLQQIKMWNRTACPADSGLPATEDCHLIISRYPFGSMGLTAALGQASYSELIEGSIGTPSVLNNLPSGTTGRYIRVQLKNEGSLYLAEFEAHGCAVEYSDPVCNFTLENEHDFEAGFGFWNDGGNLCNNGNGGANMSAKAVRLRGNGGLHSSTYTDNMDLSNVSKVKFDFMLRFQGMESGDDLVLEYSTDGGTNFQMAEQWISGQGGVSNSPSFKSKTVEIEDDFSSETVFRFRCDGNANNDKAWIDDIQISTCITYNDPFAGSRPMYRTIDGTNNNFDNPEYGSVGSPLFFELPSQYGPNNSLGGQNRPGTRHISNQLSDEPQDRRDQRLLSGMAYQFGQFLDHDFVLTEGSSEPAYIPVPDYDPVFAGNGIIRFNRSAGIPGSSPRQQANIITSYIDASNVYGSDEVVASWLRSHVDGKLKTSKGNLVPYNTIDGEFDSDYDPTAPRMDGDRERNMTPRVVAVTGDFRANEHPNLTALHTIFVREHNRLCDHIKSQGETDDEIIYQKARKLVGAMMQRIVYEEYLPAFGVPMDSYSGYDSNVRPDIRNTFATAAYRWHTMVENDIILRNDACEGIGVVELPLKTIFLNPQILRQYGPGVLLRGLSFHPQYRTDLKVNNGLRNFLLGQGSGLDLVSINIQRGRDHGLPDYKTVREHYGTGSPSSFSSINSDHNISNRLDSVYGGNINDIDLWVGLFAEPLVSGTSLPATAIAIIKEQFEVLRDGDYYFYKNDPFLTNSDLSIINSSDLASIIERNTSAESMPSDIFFKPPCDDSDPFEDLNDHEGKEVCTGIAAKYYTSCTNSSGSGSNLALGMNTPANVQKIKVTLGFAVKITNNLGNTTYYTDDTGCLPSEFAGSNITSIQVICLSDDDSTIDCSGFAGALFTSCWGSPLPIFTTGIYNTEQLKSLSVSNNSVQGIRVNNGFKVTLYKENNLQGYSEEFVGPTVICLSGMIAGNVSSMKAICLSNPSQSNCGNNGVAGAVFENDDNHPNEEEKHIGVSVGPGDYDLSRLNKMGVADDDIDKVKVNNGFAITLFKHDNFLGNSRTYLGDRSSLGNFGDKASSMKVTCIESNQNTNVIVGESLLNFELEKESDMAMLEVTYNLLKDATHQSIEKFNGRTGEFELLQAFPIDKLDDSYFYYDENTSPGDNVYRVRVYYADGSEEETPYKVIRFDDLFHVYPNPVIDIVNIDLQKYIGSDVEVTIYDIRGVEIATKSISTIAQSTVSFDLSNNINGTYIVRVLADGKNAVSKKIIVAK